MAYQILSDARPKARKQHRCDDCFRAIQPGEKYRRATYVDDTLWTSIECLHCIAIVKHVEWNSDEGYWWQDFADWEPETVSHLRLKALWRKQWTRRDGTLYPIPDGGA